MVIGTAGIASPSSAGTGAASSPMSAALALDQRYGYRHIRYNHNERERDLAQRRQETLWGHVAPNSVFIAAIGNHWKPGAWQRVMDMVHYTNQYGYPCVLEEIMDRCFNPYDSLGCMRNEAILRALQGFEWLCMVDNDVYPPADMLVKLIEHNVPAIAPIVLENSSGRSLHGPPHQLWTGLQPVRWCVLSMLVFRSSIFHATGPEFWNDSIGADEGYHFQKLWHYGIQPYVDTDIRLLVGGDPTYPLSTLRMQKCDHDAFWDKRRAWLLDAPHREPIDPNDPRRSELGEYLPFLAPAPNGRIS